MTGDAALDVVTIGRSSVDLYGQQIGGRLEDVVSFAKSVGGCPTNIAVGTARLGLKSALITRVGDEQMGRFIREQLQREGVDVTGVTTDPERLTALVLLGVRDERSSPMIFVRENCADMALDEGDVDERLIARATAIVVTGTHFSRENTARAQKCAIALAKRFGSKIVFDIDYRPNLWGLAGHDAGFSRFVASDAVTAHLQTILPDCDLIVGTEEEIAIAAGCEHMPTALNTIRSLTAATIVLKRGPMGCVVYDGEIPADLEQGIVGRGFAVEVYNVLGAGDAFMSGFLRGWLKGETLATAATWANACGALVVSRLLCAPEIPTFAELQHFLKVGGGRRALRKDAELNHIHWATTRRPSPDTLMAFAVDHRAQLEALADTVGAPRKKISDFKRLAVKAAARVAGGRPGYGMLIDSTYGRAALFEAESENFWIARPVELPGSRPLDFEGGGGLGARMIEWPATHTAKCLCFYHPDDPDPLKARQERELLRLFDTCRTIGRECLIEIIASRQGPLVTDTVANVIRRLYALGIRPDWWKLEPQENPRAWHAISQTIAENDPYCRGVVLLGLEAPEADLKRAFDAAAAADIIKGFAVGRTIFAVAAEAWLKGEIDDEAAIVDMAERFRRLCKAWQETRQLAKKQGFT